MEENVIQINSGITINADVSVKNGRFLVSIMDNLAITCDKVTESYNKEKKKLFQQILMKWKQSVKCQICIFYLDIY